MKRIINRLPGAAFGVVAALLLGTAIASDGIRVDGTEVQSASNISERATKKKEQAGVPARIYFTAAQAVMAHGARPGGGDAAKIGLGYEYNVGETADFGDCSCPAQADLDGNGFVDSVDLSILIDVVFFGVPDVTDPQCPRTRSDFDDNGVADSVDLSLIIDYVFFGGPPPANPCL